MIDQENLNKVIEYINDAYAVVGLSPDISLDLCQYALDISKQFSFNKGIGAAYLHMGIAYYHKNMYRKALELYNQALDILNPAEDAGFIGMAYNNMGILFSRWKKEKESQIYFLKSLEGVDYRLNLHMHKSAVISLNNVAQSYLRQGEEELAAQYYEKAYALSMTVDDYYCKGLTLNNIGVFFNHVEEYDRAIKYLEQSIQIFVAGELFRETIDSLNNIAEIYFKKQDYDKAVENLNQAIDKGNKLNSYYEICHSYVIFSEIYANQSDLNNRDYYIQKAFDIASDKGFTDKLLTVCDKLIEYSKSDYNYEKLKVYTDLFEKINQEIDQINNSL